MGRGLRRSCRGHRAAGPAAPPCRRRPDRRCKLSTARPLGSDTRTRPHQSHRHPPQSAVAAHLKMEPQVTSTADNRNRRSGEFHSGTFGENYSGVDRPVLLETLVRFATSGTAAPGARLSPASRRLKSSAYPDLPARRPLAIIKSSHIAPTKRQSRTTPADQIGTNARGVSLDAYHPGIVWGRETVGRRVRIDSVRPNRCATWGIWDKPGSATWRCQGAIC